MNFNEIREQISTFRERLIKYIETIPSHAEGITPLGKAGNCGIVSFSTVAKHGVMCADYYLNHTAKEELKRLIKITKLEKFDKVIVDIIQTGRIPYKPIKMNPQFISRLRDMWEKEMGVLILQEHDLVVATCDIDQNGYEIAENTQGTVIHIYKEGEAFEIEFPEGKLLTLKPEVIDHAPEDD